MNAFVRATARSASLRRSVQYAWATSLNTSNSPSARSRSAATRFSRASSSRASIRPKSQRRRSNDTSAVPFPRGWRQEKWLPPFAVAWE